MDVAQKRTELARWYLLRLMHAGRPYEVAEEILRDGLNEAMRAARVSFSLSSPGIVPDLSFTRDELHRELDYLRDRKFCEIEGDFRNDWSASITPDGTDIVEYVSRAPAGISRPPKR